MRRGQQALEYMITYGWAFVVVIVTIGAFAYFGVFNPQKYLPDRCDFGPQMACVDYQLFADDASVLPGLVLIKFQNNYGEDIQIREISTANGPDKMCTSGSSPPVCTDYSGPGISIAEGDISENIVLDLDSSEYFLVGGEKTLVPIKITFARDDPAAPAHAVVGEIFAAAQE